MPSAFADLTLLVLFLTSSASGAIIRVPTDRPTIQTGLNAAAASDTVLVEPGTYFENLYMRSHVYLASAAGPTVTIVDGSHAGPVVACDNTFDFVIHGLTLRNGRNLASPGGGGARVRYSQGLFYGCHFVANETYIDGAGISIAGSEINIQHCVFAENVAQFDGGAVFAWATTLTLESCLIRDNHADEGGGIAITNNTWATILNNVVVGNHASNLALAGGGLLTTTSNTEIRGNTFVNNETHLNGACIGIGPSGSRVVALHNNIVSGATGNGVETVGNLENACNDVWGSQNDDWVGCSPGIGGISEDPLFCDMANDDFTIDAASPCAPEHSGGCDLIGALPVGCGTTAVEPTTWGSIKRSFE
jgi:hypothetical protein